MRLTLLYNSDDPEFSENAAVLISENHSKMECMWRKQQFFFFILNMSCISYIKYLYLTPDSPNV